MFYFYKVNTEPVKYNMNYLVVTIPKLSLRFEYGDAHVCFFFPQTARIDLRPSFL